MGKSNYLDNVLEQMNEQHLPDNWVLKRYTDKDRKITFDLYYRDKFQKSIVCHYNVVYRKDGTHDEFINYIYHDCNNVIHNFERKKKKDNTIKLLILCTT